MEQSSRGEVVKELHSDLARKYKLHAAAVESAWQSFDRNQRATCLKAGAADGVVLKHSKDASMGNVCKLIPEWNLRDITEPKSPFLLDLLTHRSTTSLMDQYREGLNGGPGDHAFIIEMMQTRGLKHVDSFKDCYTFFLGANKYGESVKIMSNHAEMLAKFSPAINAGLCTPQSTGELILQRQLYLLQSLNIIIEDILDEGSKSRGKKEPTKRSDKAAAAALSRLSIIDSPAKLALPDLVACARDQKESLEEYLGLLSAEPVVLTHAVNIHFFSRPELLADEKGRRLAAHTDKYISGAFFEAVHSAVRGAAIWNYLSRLLELLEKRQAEKTYRAIILQEITNVCHLEYARAQALFKRHVQTAVGSQWFKRVSNGYDKSGMAKVTLKRKPEDLTRSDPQLHYVLRLCQAETGLNNAPHWVKKLADLHQAHPAEREKLQDREFSALCDLIVVVSFFQDLSSVITLPSLSRKDGREFVVQSEKLEAELNELRKGIDLLDFATPIDNLLEPGMAEGALKALDEYAVGKLDTSLGLVYYDLATDCFNHLQNRCHQARAKLEESKGAAKRPQPFISDSQPAEVPIEPAKEKTKTRPPHSSVYQVTPQVEEVFPATETSTPSQTLTVKGSTADAFSKLFAKSQAHGSVEWVAFEAAMADVGFSVFPKFGSVYTFNPPRSLGAKRSLTVHRPHQSRIEGYLIPIISRRLKRVYGWNEKTFQVR